MLELISLIIGHLLRFVITDTGGIFIPAPAAYFFIAFFVPSFVLIVTVLLYFLAYFVVFAGAAVVMGWLEVFAPIPPVLRIVLALAIAAAAIPAVRWLKKRKPRGPVCELARLREPDAGRFGVKAVSLGEISAAGLCVPFGFGVSSELFERFRKTNSISGPDYSRTGPGLIVDLKTMRGRIRKGRFCRPDVMRLRLMYGALTLRFGMDPPLIVRSSFGGEDLPGRLAPGQYMSYGAHGTFSEFLSTIKECWCSFYTESAMMYRRKMEIGHDPKLSVIVQGHIEAELLGTASAAGPATGYREEIAIDISAPPAGEPHAVTEQAEAETIIVNTALHFPAPPADPRFPFIGELVRGLRVLSREGGDPPLVEWAFAGGRLYYLQLRPLTGLREVETYIAAGMAELTPEALCPMTVSLIEAERSLDSFITAPIAKYMKRGNAEGILRKINGRIYAGFEALDSLTASLTPGVTELLGFVRLCIRQRGETLGIISGLDRLMDEIEAADISAMPVPVLMENIERLNRAMQGAGADAQATAAHLTQVLGALLEKAAAGAGIPVEKLRALPAYEEGCIALERIGLLREIARADKSFADVKILKYKERFGYLSPGDEIDLTVPRISEDDSALAALASSGGSESETKNRAGSMAKLTISHHGQNIVPWDAIVFELMYRWMKRYATLREELKFRLLRGWSLIRNMLIGIGGTEPAASKLSSAEQVFFLEFDELKAVLSGGEVPGSPAERERRFSAWRDEGMSSILHLDPEGNVISESAATDETEGVYRGIPVRAGTVTGIARKISGPGDVESVGAGDIAVVDVSSPWMSVLFHRVDGLVSVSGGVVSHLALAAREYGCPMVVGVNGLEGMDIDGKRIELDAGGGTVKISGGDGE
mgnify:CR=1 FL=1